MNTAPFSSIVAVVAVTIATLFLVVNLSRNTVTEHTPSADDTIQKFLPKQFVSA